MNEKPTYKELEQKVVELEKKETDTQQRFTALQKIQNSWEEIFNTVGHPIFILDKEHKVLSANRAVGKINGFSEAEIIGKKCYEVFHNSSNPAPGCPMERLLASGATDPVEMEMEVAGKVFQVVCTPVFDNQGSLDKIIHIATDITERKRAEEALRDIEKKYRLLTENITDTIWVIEIDTLRFTYVSPSTSSYTGFSGNEIASRKLNDLLTTSSMEIAATAMSEELTADDAGLAKPRILELEFYHKDGSTVWAEVAARFVRDTEGRPCAIVGVARDISERRLMEQKLRESEKMYRLLADNITDTIWVMDIDTLRFSYVSPSTKTNTGFSSEEIASRQLDDLLTPASMDFAASAMSEELTAENTGLAKPRTLELEFYHKNGSTVWTEVSARFVRDMKGRPLAIVGVSRDIEERKRAEKEKTDLEEQLRHAQKMESIGTLSGGIAHDFNNILSIIIGNTELALDDVPEWNSAHANLEEIKSAGLRAKNIVSQLLAFSRKTDQHLNPTAIVPVIKDALQFLRSTIPASIDICADIIDNGETVLADPVQLNQIMMNLSINASQAMEQTGGVLSVNVESLILDNTSGFEVPDLVPGDYVKIIVSDTGTGISPDIADRIFDPYFTTKDIGKGSGMGLAVVHGIVKNHNGSISVDSEPGKGTVFTILLPKIDEQPETETKPTTDLPTGSETILFVDDEASIMKLGQRMLERLGYKIDATTSPAEALEWFRSNPDKYDLIITDMTMPKMTGADLAKELLRLCPDIPIIICSGHSAIIDYEKARALGIAAYIMKPIDKQKIAKIIRQVLDKEKKRS